jgi:hypothetical protein
VSSKVATKAYSGSTKRSGTPEVNDLSPVVAQATKRNKTKGSAISSVSTGAFTRGVNIGTGDIVLVMHEHTWWPCEVGADLSYFGDCLSGMSETEVASLTAHTGLIAKIFAREGECPRFCALSATNELRLMTSADRAPRCATAALKEAFVEARHCMLASPSTKPSPESQLRIFGGRWEDIAACVGDYGVEDEGEDDEDEESHVNALTLLADASADGRHTSLSEAAELMAAMKRHPEMNISSGPVAMLQDDTAELPPPGFFALVQEPGAPPPQFAAI